MGVPAKGLSRKSLMFLANRCLFNMYEAAGKCLGFALRKEDLEGGTKELRELLVESQGDTLQIDTGVELTQKDFGFSDDEDPSDWEFNEAVEKSSDITGAIASFKRDVENGVFDA